MMMTRCKKDIHPTVTLRKAMDKLWQGPAIGAASMFRQLAAEMELLYSLNNGEQFSPDVVCAIEDSEAHSWMEANRG